MPVEMCTPTFVCTFVRVFFPKLIVAESPKCTSTKCGNMVLTNFVIRIRLKFTMAIK